MILKVVLAQPVFDNDKRGTQTPKDGLKKKKVSLFASVLADTIYSKTTHK